MHVAHRKTGCTTEKRSRHRWIVGFVCVADKGEIWVRGGLSLKPLFSNNTTLRLYISKKVLILQMRLRIVEMETLTKEEVQSFLEQFHAKLKIFGSGRHSLRKGLRIRYREDNARHIFRPIHPFYSLSFFTRKAFQKCYSVALGNSVLRKHFVVQLCAVALVFCELILRILFIKLQHKPVPADLCKD